MIEYIFYPLSTIGYNMLIINLIVLIACFSVFLIVAYLIE